MMSRSAYFLCLSLMAAGPCYSSELLSLSAAEQEKILGWHRTQTPSICPGFYALPTESAKDPVLGLAFDSDEAEIYEKEGKATLTGHVSVRQGPYKVTSEKAELRRDIASKQLYYLSMQDYVRLILPGMTLISDFADYNVQTQDANLHGVLYHFKQPWQGDVIDSVGTAKSIKKRGQGQLTLKNASYSSCPLGSAPWHVRASRLFVNQETGWASVTHARFYIGRVPILYFPYYRFPVSDTRQSGLLMPSLNYENDTKLSVTLPMYLNLAPNLDATYYPSYRQTQGWIHGLEMRGLSRNGRSDLRFDMIDQDRLFARFQQEAHAGFSGVEYRDRYLKLIDEANSLRASVFWNGEANFGRFWSLNWQLERLSDPYVYRDISEDEAKKSLDQVESKLDLTYHQNHWSAGALFQQFQTLHRIDEDEVEDQYRLLPQLHLGYDKVGSRWALSWQGEWTNFDRGPDFLSQTQKVTGQRSYAEVKGGKLLRYGHYKAIPSVLLRGLLYQHLQGEGYHDDDKHKAIPSLLLDQVWHFDRRLHHDQWQQTLKPRLFALWTPYRDQDALPQFDSSWTIPGYETLFSPYRFTGRDRVSDEGRIAYGLETELKRPDHPVALLNAKIGSGVAFRDRKVCLNDPCDDETANERLSPLVADVTVHVSDEKHVRAQWAWLPGKNHVDNASLSWHYQHSRQKLWDLSYEYQRDNAGHQAKQTVNSGLIWSFSPRWQGFVGGGYDLRKHRLDKSYLGLNYESCCWASRLMLTKELKSDHNQLGVEYDHGVKLQVMLKGLGAVGPSAGSTLLKKFNPQYQDPYASGLLGS